jgi:hypothetical protein
MADEPERQRRDEQGPPPTPIDHPLFLPVILVGLALWFGYDGFISDDPKMREHLTFNRGGFALTALGAIWSGYRGLREWKQMRKDRSQEKEEGSEGSRPPPIT